MDIHVPTSQLLINPRPIIHRSGIRESRPGLVLLGVLKSSKQRGHLLRRPIPHDRMAIENERVHFVL